MFLSFLEKKKNKRRDFGFVNSSPSWHPGEFNSSLQGPGARGGAAGVRGLCRGSGCAGGLAAHTGLSADYVSYCPCKTGCTVDSVPVESSLCAVYVSGARSPGGEAQGAFLLFQLLTGRCTCAMHSAPVAPFTVPEGPRGPRSSTQPSSAAQAAAGAGQAS